jgi:hypothetical protein
MEIQPEAVAYDASPVQNPHSLKISKSTSRVATVRSERGYPATKYDASPVSRPKTLRRQFGQKYDPKKVRNRCSPA